MVDIANSEAFTPYSSGLVTSLGTTFKAAMDTVLIAGRNLVLDLPPAQQSCNANCKYNPTYDRFTEPNGRVCGACGGRGFVNIGRQTTYKCNRRWTNEPYEQLGQGEDTVGGRIIGNFVRVKTHIASLAHIKEAKGATLDGVKITLYEEPRKTGWADQVYYLVSWWEKAQK